MRAQHSWAIATIGGDKDMPSFTEYHCTTEKGANGIDYFRIYDESFRIRKEYYNPVQLPYGYRLSDRHIYIYDFDNEEEQLAFDFTLSAGDHFTTYNGMEWEVESAIDTLVNIYDMGSIEECEKRLLKVHSVDGRFSDEWMEDFGSFANHFMILPMNEGERPHTLWMEYDYGYYIVREISSDPLFTHDSRPTEKVYNDGQEVYVNTTYKDGTLIVEDLRWHTPNREYTCFYHEGDNLYYIYMWALNPATDIAISVLRKDTAYYSGLPAPKNDKYIIHYNMEDWSPGENTKIEEITDEPNNIQTESSIFDLNGRKHISPLTRGIYIIGGQKILVK